MVSGGKWSIGFERVEGSSVQVLKWWHGPGEQKITVKGVRRRQGGKEVEGEEAGYLELWKQCGVM